MFLTKIYYLLISRWAYDLKMLFNADLSKPAEVLFSRKRQVQTHQVLIMNDIQVQRVPYQKHLGIIIDNKLDFKAYVCYFLSNLYFFTK